MKFRWMGRILKAKPLCLNSFPLTFVFIIGDLLKDVSPPSMCRAREEINCGLSKYHVSVHRQVKWPHEDPY